MTLALSIIALLLGPFIYAASRNNPLSRKIFDWLVLVTIAVIILLHIIPEALEVGGVWAIAILMIGFAFPVLLERTFRSAVETAHLVIVAIAAAGLLLHALIDGLALLPESGAGLAYAIILHRPAVGMAVWWAVRPTFGVAAAAATLGALVVATTAGYFVGDAFLQFAGTKTLALLQAFISGSLVHVVLFGAKHKH